MSIYLGDTPIANTGYDKANTDLSNLTSTGKNIANWSSNVTNCITEIPQDIKLELNNGTLTLKAGSKVYVPNGFNGSSPKFDVFTIEADRTSTRSANTQEIYICRATGGTQFNQWKNVYSGSTAPTGQTYMLWYDTGNNKVKVTGNGGSSWVDGYSLPVCLATSNSTQITSIDQVFNGFGYIGSTVFALPGVKGLIPKGRNADGSLKNTEFTLNGVKIWNTVSANLHSKILYDLSTDNLLCPNDATFLTRRIYNEKENIWTLDGARENYCKLGSFVADSISPYKITSLTPKTAFHAVDYNDAVLTSSLATCHIVTQTYVNGTSWYRVYDDGWVEQGGYSLYNSANPTNPRTVTLLKTMANTNYTITNSTDNAWSSNPLTYSRIACVYSKATTNFQMTGIFSNGAGTDYSFYWQVSGKGA